MNYKYIFVFVSFDAGYELRALYMISRHSITELCTNSQLVKIVF